MYATQKGGRYLRSKQGGRGSRVNIGRRGTSLSGLRYPGRPTKSDQVGYTIRFEDVSDKERTRILYMTDGMLFRETLVDPLLSRYSVIMVSFHSERVPHELILISRL